MPSFLRPCNLIRNLIDSTLMKGHYLIFYLCDSIYSRLNLFLNHFRTFLSFLSELLTDLDALAEAEETSLELVLPPIFRTFETRYPNNKIDNIVSE